MSDVMSAVISRGVLVAATALLPEVSRCLDDRPRAPEPPLPMLVVAQFERSPVGEQANDVGKLPPLILDGYEHFVGVRDHLEERFFFEIRRRDAHGEGVALADALAQVDAVVVLERLAWSDVQDDIMHLSYQGEPRECGEAHEESFHVALTADGRGFDEVVNLDCFLCREWPTLLEVGFKVTKDRHHTGCVEPNALPHERAHGVHLTH